MLLRTLSMVLDMDEVIAEDEVLAALVGGVGLDSADGAVLCIIPFVFTPLVLNRIDGC